MFIFDFEGMDEGEYELAKGTWFEETPEDNLMKHFDASVWNARKGFEEEWFGQLSFSHFTGYEASLLQEYPIAYLCLSGRSWSPMLTSLSGF
jgi:hypothetical protein